MVGSRGFGDVGFSGEAEGRDGHAGQRREDAQGVADADPVCVLPLRFIPDVVGACSQRPSGLG